jgi:DNA-binding IclR family transcriptional regulator
MTMTTNESGARMVRFEGVTVRSDALNMLQMVLHTSMTAGDVAKARGRTPGSTSNTLKRMVEVGLLVQVALPPSHAKISARWGAIKGYRCTDLGRRMLEAAEQQLTELEEQDPETSWPKVDTHLMVMQAMQTQPSSVFDLARARMAPANASQYAIAAC